MKDDINIYLTNFQQNIWHKNVYRKRISLVFVYSHELYFCICYFVFLVSQDNCINLWL